MHDRRKSVTSSLPDDGTGTVQVYRVKGFKLEELPEKSHGVFYSGDCYVILYTYLKNGRERHIIYFWLVSTLFKTRGGGYTRKNWAGVCCPLPKTLTLLMAKICDIPYPIYDLTINSKPYL